MKKTLVCLLTIIMVPVFLIGCLVNLTGILLSILGQFVMFDGKNAKRNFKHLIKR